MKSVYCTWSDEEIIHLFSFIEQKKTTKQKLVDIFKEYALLTHKKPNSVRNYYYLEIKELNKNKEKLQRLNIDLDLHKVIKQQFFNNDSSSELFDKIEELVKRGYSVRGACMLLANNDSGLMLRYQNKYRNILYKNKICNKTNIIKMPTQSTKIGDKEIESLFLGLVRLVKKTALEQADAYLKHEAEFANDTLRKVLVKLNGKENALKQLGAQNKLLKLQNENLEKKVSELRSVYANDIVNSKQMSKLKKYMEVKSKDSKIKTSL